MYNIDQLKIEADICIKEEKTVLVDNRGQQKIYKIIDHVGQGEFQAKLQNVDNVNDVIYIGLPGVIKAIKGNKVLGYG